MRKAATAGVRAIAFKADAALQGDVLVADSNATLSAYTHGLKSCLVSASELSQSLPDIVLKMEHCRLRQRLGRCLISTVRHTRALERLLGESRDNPGSMADAGVLDAIGIAGEAVSRPPGQRLSVICGVRAAVAAQHAILQHVCTIATAAGRGHDLAVLNAMREECSVLDGRLHAAAQEIAAMEPSSRMPPMPRPAPRLRCRESATSLRVQLKLVGRGEMLMPSPSVRMHWRIADA